MKKTIISQIHQNNLSCKMRNVTVVDAVSGYFVALQIEKGWRIE